MKLQELVLMREYCLELFRSALQDFSEGWSANVKR